MPYAGAMPIYRDCPATTYQGSIIGLQAKKEKLASPLLTSRVVAGDASNWAIDAIPAGTAAPRARPGVGVRSAVHAWPEVG